MDCGAGLGVYRAESNSGSMTSCKTIWLFGLFIKHILLKRVKGLPTARQAGEELCKTEGQSSTVSRSSASSGAGQILADLLRVDQAGPRPPILHIRKDRSSIEQVGCPIASTYIHSSLRSEAGCLPGSIQCGRVGQTKQQVPQLETGLLATKYFVIALALVEEQLTVEKASDASRVSPQSRLKSLDGVKLKIVDPSVKS
ncbi:hypothetical protein PtA15_14A259 [Puccinia triticina]|uniref:Uncharacterized protein n=1 Tax=Puccinia triticina TaxID=208348 RepID=A0ABY7D4W0_9BASI|nr:uncharacterized protein PtA15_14A259 [Puccinia triticina]WAQ91376.1 hypothetical protein PtA15_14A259 [Puccinia triticina]WAR62177.1 hypothetical protein PtB15_14B271 [Puccinia triticina]